MDIGGRNKKDDKDKKNPGKGKEKELTEEEMPRNKKYMEDEKRKGKQVAVPDDGYDPPASWDWGNFAGIVSNVVDQGDNLSCWAIAFIRAIEALYNIGKRLEEQRSFSIQHLVNNVPVKKFGLEETETLADFINKNGIMEEGECSYRGAQRPCAHDNPTLEYIDELVIVNDVDDVDLVKLVWRHPVVGVIPIWKDFEQHGREIYRPRKSETGEGLMSYHAVLITGYGVDNLGNYYWRIQNSWGVQWWQRGFGQLHREHKRGRRSLFVQVYYGKKKGYPQKRKK